VQFLVYRLFTDVAAGRLMQPGVQQVGDFWFRANTELYCRPS